jgi:hypothetical protein
MKKYKTIIISVLGFLTFFTFEHVYAASALINVTSPNTTVIVGNNVTVYYTISSANAIGAWDFQLVTPSNFRLNSCNDGQLAHHVKPAPTNNTKSFTISCSFTATGSGNGTFTIKNYEIEGYTTGTMAVQIGPKTINAMTNAEVQASLSKNNNLSSLSVTGAELSPAFNKDTLIYNVTLEPETKSATINATVEDSRSTFAGTGTQNLEEGLNVFKINVKAQNGTVKTYTLNITVKELVPIEVTIDDVLYKVVRKKEEIKVPNKYFKETSVTIGEVEVPGFINEVTSNLLVGLKDDKGEIKLYTYNEASKSYTIYKDFTFNSLILEIIESDSNIPDKFSKATITINEEKVTAYKLSDKSTFALFNARDIATGKENLYMYDSDDNTVMKYNSEEKALLNKEIRDIKDSKKQYEYIIIALGGFLTLTYFIILIKLITGKKKKNKIKKETEVINENIVDEIPDNDTQENDNIEEDFLDEKKKKRRKKD